MLDVITDFWKPVKKSSQQEKPDLDRLQVGSKVAFGGMPQTLISNRETKISSINTYQFADERMTSFVLSQEKDDSVSLIVASIEGEEYLALSRRIPFAERMRMFDPAELEAVVENQESDKLVCHEIDPSWKNWLVQSYNKEISGLRGYLVKGDFRKEPPPSSAVLQNFDYVLLTSDNNEYAIEIERYTDGRLELYATIYRRVSDIVSLENPGDAEEDRMKTPSLEADDYVQEENTQPEQSGVAPSMVPSLYSSGGVKVQPEEKAFEDESTAAECTVSESEDEFEEKELAYAEANEDESADASSAVKKEKKEAFKTELQPPPKPLSYPSGKTATDKPKATDVTAKKSGQNVVSAAELKKDELSTQSTLSGNKENKTMQENKQFTNGNGQQSAASAEVVAMKKEKIEQDNDSVECDLKVANKIIDEAIRNEMRLSDVVRRVIALPVANPQAVQIPITLLESDYQLLAIRYGLSPNDKEAIKARIIDELEDFSGGAKD